MIQQIESSAKWQLLGLVIAFTIAGVIFATASITNSRNTAVQQEATNVEQSSTIEDLNAQLQLSRQWNAQLQSQLDLARRDLATANATIQSLRSEVVALRNNLTSSMNGSASGAVAPTPADLELARVRLEESGYIVLPFHGDLFVILLGLAALALSALLSLILLALRRAHNS